MNPEPRSAAIAAGPPGFGRVGGWLMPAAFALAAIAALMGIRFHLQPTVPVASPAHVGGDILTHLQVAIASLGLLVGGIAVYRAGATASSLATGAVLAFFSVIAIPPIWDSLRLLAGVLGLVAAVGSLLALMPPVGRRLTLSVLVLVHFGGILVAVTSPSPQPWVSGQAWTRFYRPYLQFMYLNNAYHFYSPEPGPASLLWVCYEWKEPVKDAAGTVVRDDKGNPVLAEDSRYTWFEFPRRPDDANDPMSVTYYRRVSCVEQINQMNAVIQGVPPDVAALRSMAASPARSDNIPYHPQVPMPQQYRPVTEAARRTQIPSYARALSGMAKRSQEKLRVKRAGLTGEAAKRGPNEPGDDWVLVGLKLYRTEHTILTPELFSLPYKEGEPYKLYDPITYKPYFLGDFDTDGNLRDPGDALLYWLVPVLDEESAPNAKAHWKFDGKDLRRLRDYTLRHATGRFDTEEKR